MKKLDFLIKLKSQQVLRKQKNKRRRAENRLNFNDFFILDGADIHRLQFPEISIHILAVKINILYWLNDYLQTKDEFLSS